MARHRHRRTRRLARAVASWYSLPGNTTACGQRLPAFGLANKSLPCGTRVYLCVAACAVVPVIDRGPYVSGRMFDLTRSVAAAVGFSLSAGVETVRYRVLP